MSKTAVLDWTKAFEEAGPVKSKKDMKVYQGDVISESSVTKYLAPTLFATAIITPIAIMATSLLGAPGVETIQLITQAVEPIQHTVSNVPAQQLVDASHIVTTSGDVISVAAQAGGSSWDRLIGKVLWITDYLMDGVIIFSGVSWMFGNRTKAIELLFSAGVGYTIIRHYDDIKNFFALI